MRRSALGTLAALLLTLGGSAPRAQSHALTIVAPAAPGGGWDQTARAMQRALLADRPRDVVQVENVAGAAGTIGLARFVSGERGRPEALLITGLVMVSGIATTGSVASLADTTPIARLTGEHEVIVVPAASPHRTMADLLAAFRAAPAAVSWGGGSAGGTDDLLVRLIAEAVGVAPAAANYVAFSGGGEALAAVLGGQVTAGVSGYGEFAQSIATGQLRALASSAPERGSMPDIPTLREAGVAIDLANWRGVVAPPGISAAEETALIARVRAMAGSAAWRETLQRTGWTDAYLDGAAFRQFLLAEQARVHAVIARLDDVSGATCTRRWQPTSRTAPIGASIAVAGLAALLWRQRRRPEIAVPSHIRAGIAPAVWLVTALLAQAVLMPAFGFVPVAAVIFALTSRFLGSRQAVRDAGIGVALALAMTLLFTWGLDVPLPRGGVWPWTP